MDSSPKAASAASAATLTPAATLPVARRRRSARSPLVQALIRTVRNPMGLFGISVFGLLVITAVAAPLIAPHDPAEQIRGMELKPPSLAFPFGTDQLGRDLLSRIIYGGRASLIVGVLSVALGASVGVSTGLIAGYIGGWVDIVIMRIYDALLAFPGILLGIAVVAVTGPGIFNVAIAIGIAQMPGDARLTRSIVLSVRERDFVLAARNLGASRPRIMLTHILPNTLPPLLVQFSLAMGFAVLAEASLSFLGLGTQPPTPSWGGMLNDSRAYLRQAAWYGIWPGVALAVLLVGLNYLSDALRNALDPRRVNVG
jgi:ABC-type dipeptide/oligopeptide/nickel transport system permease subunit